MDERSGRRGKRWLEMIYTKEVTSLAKRYDVSLDEKLIRFLEEYSEVVLHVTSKQKEKKTNQLQLQHELDDVNKVVQEEVHAMRKSLFPNNEEAERYFFAIQHKETYLPIIHLAIRGLPELLVHVTRTYARRRKGISFGLLSKSNGGVLRGAMARAANYLRHRCRDRHWDLSVSEVVNIWYQQALDIPPEQERMRPEKTPHSVAKRRRSIRRRARLKPEMHTSITAAHKERKEQKLKRTLSEGGDEQSLHFSPSETLKRRRTEKADVSEAKELSATAAMNRKKEAAIVLREDKALEPQLSGSPLTETRAANSPTCVVPKATTVAKKTLEREENAVHNADLEPRRETMAEEHGETSFGKAEEEKQNGPEKRTLGASAGKEDETQTRTKVKLVASEFLTSSSQARHKSHDGEFKQVDIDEGFDTIGGLADYDSDESDYESADHNSEHAQPRQQICFEQVDIDDREKSGFNEIDGGVAEVGKTVEVDESQDAPTETRFASYRFADALSAVNLAGNDGDSAFVKRENEEHAM
ncbi:hypothetical protein FGB62_22g358 [Gracilaria domingensis]|nr:hypothetical protein FGB62_22g358 [Gracilaria domingensis]